MELYLRLVLQSLVFDKKYNALSYSGQTGVDSEQNTPQPRQRFFYYVNIWHRSAVER